MQLKNIDGLVQRLEDHKEEDHYLKQHYGSLTFNGEAQFKGCAMGCAAMPAKLEDYIAELKANVDSEDGLPTANHYATVTAFDGKVLVEALRDHGSDKPRYSIDFGQHWQEEKIAEDFGLCRYLVRIAEAIFEGAIGFPRSADVLIRFARMLPEGAVIDDDEARALWERAGGGSNTDHGAIRPDWPGDHEIDGLLSAFEAELAKLPAAA